MCDNDVSSKNWPEKAIRRSKCQATIYFGVLNVSLKETSYHTIREIDLAEQKT